MKINIGKKIISTFKGFATEKKVSKKIDFIKNSKFTIYLQKMQIKNGKGHMRSGYGLSLPRLVLAAKHSMICSTFFPDCIFLQLAGTWITSSFQSLHLLYYSYRLLSLPFESPDPSIFQKKTWSTCNWGKIRHDSINRQLTASRGKWKV